MRITSLLLILFLSCSADYSKKKHETFEIPSYWEKDFSVKLYEGGGMLPESTDIYFRTDSCFVNDFHDSFENHYAFLMLEKDKEELINYLKSKELTKIRTKPVKETIYDKGTISICLSKADQQFCLEEGATMNIHEKDYPAFMSAYQHLTDFAWNKLESQKVSITVELGEGLRNIEQIMTFSISGSAVGFRSDQQDFNASLNFQLLPGDYYFEAHLEEKSSGNMLPDNVHEPVKIEKNAVLKLDLIEGKLQIVK